MSIQRSSSAEIKLLIEAMGGTDETGREAAVARLAIIGPRAVDQLLQEFTAGASDIRVGVLRALEAIGDPRALAPSRAALEDGSALVQTAAIGALRALVTGGSAQASRDAFDALVAVALDRRRIASVRLAAWDAINEAAEDAREPLRRALAEDPDPAVAGRMGMPAVPADGSGTWEQAIAGNLPALPETLKTALDAHKPAARLTDLQRLVDRVRAREQQESHPRRREEWRAIRGAIHHALAARNSRLALYDLRDSLLGSERLPGAFLAAMEEIGDATCLDTLAAAHDATSRSGDTWLREHIAAAFRAIVQREGLTRRHASVKRVLARWPDAATELMGR
jgi:HEAT repeat protein